MLKKFDEFVNKTEKVDESVKNGDIVMYDKDRYIIVDIIDDQLVLRPLRNPYGGSYSSSPMSYNTFKVRMSDPKLKISGKPTNEDTIYTNTKGGKFWGDAGAGILVISKDTKKILVAHRSEDVNEPNTWGVFGGAVNDTSDIKKSALRELEEETEYNGTIELIPAYIFRSKTFEYHNFIGIVPKEFVADLDWENDDYKWITFDELMELEPKHFGLVKLLNDRESINIIKSLL